MTRGVSRQILFEEKEDYVRYLDTLSRLKASEPFEILAYCLMDNHVHLLIQKTDSLDRLMKRVTCSYAYYYNEKYERTGHLFQDRYRSEPIEDDPYLLAVVRYIHNNPLKAGISKREDYPWSSWHEYVGTPSLVNPSLVLEMTGGLDGFLRLSESQEELEFLEITERSRLSDRQAINLIREKLHLDSGTSIQTMDRAKRDECLLMLKQSGLSCRQIERLTGINRGVIQRLCQRDG